MPYDVQLVYGQTDLLVKINLISVLIFLPSIVIMTPIYGAEGAGWVWVFLNAFYLFICAHFMYKRVLIKEKWRWYCVDLFVPLFFMLITVASCKMLMPVAESVTKNILVLAITTLLTILIGVISAGQVRNKFKDFFWLRMLRN
jgi:O-antigen/teichoic acid export membrane protein